MTKIATYYVHGSDTALFGLGLGYWAKQAGIYDNLNAAAAAKQTFANRVFDDAHLATTPEMHAMDPSGHAPMPPQQQLPPGFLERNFAADDSHLLSISEQGAAARERVNALRQARAARAQATAMSERHLAQQAAANQPPAKPALQQIAQQAAAKQTAAAPAATPPGFWGTPGWKRNLAGAGIGLGAAGLGYGAYKMLQDKRPEERAY